ncbi:EF-hand domain-containing protein [Plasmodiophora brassicae]
MGRAVSERLRRRSSAFVGDCDAYDHSMPRPFAYRGEGQLNTPREIAKIVLMCVLLVPVIRCLLLAVVVLLTLIITRLTLIGWKKGHDARGATLPMPVWRRNILSATARAMSHCILFCFGVYRVKVIGRPDRRCKIIVSNHVSVLDGFALTSQVACMAVAKQEVEKIPLLGSVATALQFIFIDRGSSSARSDVLQQIKERTQMDGFPPLLIFPEGTTSNNTTLLRFKKGGFVASVPVQPVALKYPWEYFDPSWTNYSPQMGGTCFRLLCQVYTSVEVTWLPVVTPTPEEAADPQLFADNVRTTMARVMRLPIVPFSAEDSVVDGWLQSKNRTRKHIEAVDVGISVYELKQRFNIRLEQIKVLIDEFNVIDSNKDRVLSIEEMTAYVGSDDFVRRVFFSFDSNDSGFIDYREFIIGCLTLNDEDDVSRREPLTFRDIVQRTRALYVSS